MKGIQKTVIYILILFMVPFMSCINGLDPLPTDISDLTMSLSIPVGKVDVYRNATTPGLPYIRPNIPDWAKFDALYYADTVTVDLAEIYNKSSAVSYLAFKINIWNEFPVEGVATIFFADSSLSTIYSFNSLVVERGRILYNGNIVNAGYSGETVTFDNTQIENLRTAEYLIFNVKLKIKDGNTNDFQYYDNFKLTCQLGARVDFVLNDI